MAVGRLAAARRADHGKGEWMKEGKGFVAAGGKRLEYRWIGPRPDEAPTLVFLHEGLGSAGLWRDFPDRLAAATGLGALVYSRAGYGRSDPAELPRPVAFMHAEAEVLEEVLEACAVRDPILVGHSDGASIALIYAGRRDGPRPRALILEAPHVFTEPHGLASIDAIGEEYRASPRLRERLARHHAHPDVAFRGWNDVWLDPEFRAWNIEEFLPRMNTPVLLIQGEDDEYGTWAQIEAIRAQVRDVEVVGIPRCGHSPHREHPEHVIAAMAGFLAQKLPQITSRRR